jgi:small subunit ribosomal protein S20
LANKRSALKAHRQSERKRLRNRAVRSEVRTYVKKARVGLAAGSAEEAAPAVVAAARELDKAANKNVIHRNQAARRKSRLMKRLAAIANAPAPVETTEKPPTTRRRASTTRSTTTRARTPKASA